MTATPPLTEDAYEPIRAALFDCPPGQSATAAKARLAEAIRADPLPLMLWLTDAGIVEHVQFTVDDRRVRMSIKDAPPFDERSSP